MVYTNHEGVPSILQDVVEVHHQEGRNLAQEVHNQQANEEGNGQMVYGRHVSAGHHEDLGNAYQELHILEMLDEKEISLFQGVGNNGLVEAYMVDRQQSEVTMYLADLQVT